MRRRPLVHTPPGAGSPTRSCRRRSRGQIGVHRSSPVAACDRIVAGRGTQRAPADHGVPSPRRSMVSGFSRGGRVLPALRIPWLLPARLTRPHGWIVTPPAPEPQGAQATVGPHAPRGWIADALLPSSIPWTNRGPPELSSRGARGRRPAWWPPLSLLCTASQAWQPALWPAGAPSVPRSACRGVPCLRRSMGRTLEAGKTLHILSRMRGFAGVVIVRTRCLLSTRSSARVVVAVDPRTNRGSTISLSVQRTGPLAPAVS